MEGTEKTSTADGTGGLTLETLRSVLVDFQEPVLGVVLVVESWGGATLELTPGTFTAWPELEKIIGAEGVAICQGMTGRKVLIFSAAKFDGAIGTLSGLVDVGIQDPHGRAIFGTPIYRVKGRESIPTGRCRLCGQPMPVGEEMFFYHGYSGPCPTPSTGNG